MSSRIAVLGAGIQGCCLALRLARRGHSVDLIDENAMPFVGASVNNEGKIHLGFVYARDPRQRTHRVMAQGALAFASALRDIAGLEPRDYTADLRFHYAVPHDSQLSVDQVEAHFQRVEQAVQATASVGGDDYLGGSLEGPLFRRLTEAELISAFAPDFVDAAFETREEAVDTRRLGSLLRAAVFRHPRIRFLGRTRVVGANIESTRSVVLTTDHGGRVAECAYEAVGNCLWSGRLAVDATVGLVPESPWLFRYKAIVRVPSQYGRAAACTVPSTTFVVGPYGDVVDYGNGSFYLSWYPLFKLVETRTLDGASLSEALADIDRQELAREGTAALSRYMPALSRLLDTDVIFEVGGGVIFGWGDTDIDDPESGLHERWRIGPYRYGPYVTVDTGKYTMAPYFALEAAGMIEDALAGVPQNGLEVLAG